MNIEHSEFQYLLYKKFIIEDRYKVNVIAPLLNVSPSTLYAYIEGKRYFPPDLISRLYNATKDIDFLNFVVRDTDQRIVARDDVSNLKSSTQELLDIHRLGGTLTAMFQECVSDGDISDSEKKKLVKMAESMMREIEEFTVSVKEGKGS